MKLLEQVKMLKQNYENYVILIKKGMFYTAYESDAYILNYLLSYQISDDKVGFPISSIDKVITKLQDNSISVYVQDDEIREFESEDNQYLKVLYDAKKNYFNELNAKVLLEEIEFLLKSNPENIYKIKSFISEL